MTFYILGILGYCVVVHCCIGDFKGYSLLTWDEWVGTIVLSFVWPVLVVIAAIAIALDFNDYRKTWK